MGMDAAEPGSPRSLLGTGAVLALIGSGLTALSTSLAWAVQPFSPPEVGLYPVFLPLPRLIVRSAEGRLPSVAVVVVTLALLAGGLALIGRERWLDVFRRALGVVVLAVVLLFGFRYAQLMDGIPAEFGSFPGSLRAGFYLALAGAVLMIVAGRSLRPPRPEPPPAEPLR